jgi:hypothetical protein
MNQRILGYYGFLSLAGATSLISSVIGLLMLKFGYPKSAHSMSDLLFWLLPSLSLVAFGLALGFRVAGRLAAWLLYAGSLATVCWVNWQQCAQGKCDTNSLWHVCLSTAIAVPHLWFLFVAALALQLAPGNADPSDAEPRVTGS